MILENTEDWERRNRGHSGCSGIYPCPNGPSLLNADFQMKLNYYPSFNPASQAQGGRHFREFSSITGDPWGIDNISFADGHVGSYSMHDIVMQSAQTHWYEYPFLPSASVSFGASTNPPGPAPGAEWWMVPHW